jgi:SAM-dependent methyltransferase
MSTYDASTYGERTAGVYDDWYAAYDDAMVTTLAELAGGGRALELGIGTGRVALPLTQRGVHVHGIDASPAMVAKLRAKPGGDAISVTMGDFAEVAVDGSFSLIYVVFNTLFALLTQEDQVRCFQNVARHLTPAGVFAIEVFVPDLTRYRNEQVVTATKITNDALNVDATRLDPVQQLVTSQHIVFSNSGVQLYPVQLRYAWPSELDLMAQIAGLRLRHRWGGWQRESFTAHSTKHVSVYERRAS